MLNTTYTYVYFVFKVLEKESISNNLKIIIQ